MSEVTSMSPNNEQADRDASDHPSVAESVQPNSVPAGGHSAGALLRQARQAKGLHIAALAVSLKVPQRKLEALEADRYGELTDATFVRALAQTMCRALKVDPGPVLALLPQTLDPKLDRVTSGLNQPFRERPGREDHRRLTRLRRPGPLLALGLLLATAGIYFAPAGWWSGYLGGAGGAAVRPTSATPPVSEGIFPPSANVAAPPAEPDLVKQAVPVAIAAPAALAPSAPVAPAATAAPTIGSLQLRASAQTWVEVQDANGQILMSRNLATGEELGLDGPMPLKVRIGNAAGIAVKFRGKAVDLTPYTRENVARLEFK